MMEEADKLEKLIAHEAAYFGCFAEIEKTTCGWFLTSADLPAYRDANHAMRLRDDGRGADAVAQAVIFYYRSRGLPPVADIDAVAESLGIGAALRRRGVTPVIGNTLLMRFEAGVGDRGSGIGDAEAIQNPKSKIQKGDSPQSTVRNVAKEEAGAWVETALISGFEDRFPFWRSVLEREANFPACRLYLAEYEGQTAAACDLFEADGWARIDNVGTRAEFRRRGIASELVRHVIADSQANGNTLLYLFTEAGGDGERLYHRLGFTAWQLNPFRRHIG